MRAVSLIFIALGILTTVGAALAYVGNPRPVVGAGAFALPAVLLAVGFLLRALAPRRKGRP